MNNGKIIIEADPDLSELIPGYLQHRQDDLRLIAESLGKADFESLRILGHSMKGSGSGYGFDEISEIGALIEQAAKEKNPSEIRKQACALEDYLLRVVVVFK